VKVLRFTYFWNRSDFFGRASFLFRYAAYLFNAIYLLIFLDYFSISFETLHAISIAAAILLPYIVFVYYVSHDNNKGVGIRQNMVDFFVLGWFVGLIHLLYIPSLIFVIGLISNYVASRGFHKFYRIMVIPVGYLCVLPFHGFQIKSDLPDIMLHLSMIYAFIHFISIAYISYKFSKGVQVVNQKAAFQQQEILMQSKELKSLNESLKSLNDHLEEKVKDRTRELQHKNEKLAEYTFINAHQLRAPVATVLGLCNLLNYDHEVEDKDEIIRKIKHHVNILDNTIKTIRVKLETDDTIKYEVEEKEAEYSRFVKFSK
jgi:signal transduction histidine kinase